MFKEFDVFFDSNNNCYQLRTKTNIYLIEFDDAEKSALFGELAGMARENTATTDKIVRSLKKKYPEEKVIEVLATLTEYGLIPYDASHAAKNGNGANGSQKQALAASLVQNDDKKALEDQVILIIGDGQLSEELYRTLPETGCKELKVQSALKIAKNNDYSLLDTLIEKATFIVVDGSEWNPELLDYLNIKALQAKKPWLYIGGVEGRFIKMGPVFYGKETGCYNCLQQRIKSNNQHGKYLPAYEDYLRAEHGNSRRDAVLYEPLFNKITASLAAVEISKFFTHWHVPVTWRSFITIDISTYETARHQLLKVPYCDVCKPVLLYNPAPWLESVSLR